MSNPKQFLIAACIGLACLLLIVYTRPDPPAPVTKTIVNKFSPVVKINGVSASETVYYLVAGDGTYCKVSMLLYLQTRPGQKVSARYWYTD